MHAGLCQRVNPPRVEANPFNESQMYIVYVLSRALHVKPEPYTLTVTLEPKPRRSWPGLMMCLLSVGCMTALYFFMFRRCARGHWPSTCHSLRLDRGYHWVYAPAPWVSR